MKPIFLFLLSFLCTILHAQYKNPVSVTHFGVDAELIANYLYDFELPSDDWFSDGRILNVIDQGTYIIDTTGAAARAALYAIDPEFRKLPFYRPMRFPSYSYLHNQLLIDGVFIRDYHSMDSTIFASGSNKNGMSPADWSAPVAQSVPDKDDIEDMFVHVRRGDAGYNNELILFGGVTIIGITGNRYFDFEMYQTDFQYDRLNRKFIGYGPDEGHTSWTFDAQGKVVKPGDIIFTAEYGTAGITSLQARIWVNKNDMNITPAAFDWAKDAQGNFIYDGATNNSQYVYAAIVPNTTGDFYSGVQSKAGTWAGPYKFLDAGNNVLDNFSGGEFMEFSVNLTKLGLDPVTFLGGSACGLPFRIVMVKSRNSTSFNSDLNDFVEPYPIFRVPSDPGCVVLDVKDIQLKARLKEGKPLLEWTSAINDKTRYYEVQRSFDGKTYQTIAVVTNADPNAAQKAYSYRDGSVPANVQKVFFRIKAVMDGSEFTSTPLQLQLPNSLKLSVYPNPAFQNVNVSIFSDKQQKAEVTIVSAAGNTVYRQDLLLNQGANVFTLTKNNAWTPGLYIVRIRSAEGMQWQKFVLQNGRP